MKSETAGKPKQPWIKEVAVYSALRRAFQKSPAVAACWNDAKTEFFVPSKNGKQMRRVQFECAHCRNKYVKHSMVVAKKSGKKRKVANVHIDHIIPVVDPVDGNLLPDGRRDWNKQIDRLIVEKPLLQVLCKQCHSVKSKAENCIRAKVRKEKKVNEQRSKADPGPGETSSTGMPADSAEDGSH